MTTANDIATKLAALVATTPPTVTLIATREQWLIAVADACRPLFAKHKAEIPAADKLRFSCGFPRGSRKAIGQAWSTRASATSHAEIFVSPEIEDAVRVADILVHELVHVVVGIEHGHKKPFGKLARALGLEGKLTATTAGAALRAELQAIVDMVGPYPGSRLSPMDGGGPKKQSTRMLKCECPSCGYVVRTTAKWLKVGLPICPCGAEMISDATPDEDESEDA